MTEPPPSGHSKAVADGGPAASQPPLETGPATATHDDSDPDFDDLDDVLDQFSANAPSTTKSQPHPAAHPGQPTPSASGPGRPAIETIPEGPKPDETEEQFMERLSKEMQTMMSSLGTEHNLDSQSPEEILKMGQELDAFTRKMEAEGIQPEDLLKALLGQDEGEKVAEKARDAAISAQSSSPSSNAATGAVVGAAAGIEGVTAAASGHQGLAEGRTSTDKGVNQNTNANVNANTSFEETIRRTMSRLNESDSSAAQASAQSSHKSEEDMLAEMLRALESSGVGGGAGEGNEESLSKMFADMMQQLTHKDMLYEPMKELNGQYPSWLASHAPPKLKQAEFDRFQRQSVIVADIVHKFEEPGFSDEDESCREYIWERMQAMQGEGAPPEELVKNPFPGTEFGGMPSGLGGDDAQCPTQ